MARMHRVVTGAGPMAALLLTGCAASNVDFSDIARPARAPELGAYNVFVGSWDWKAEMLNGDDAHRNWTGTAEWRWTLDERCLHGEMAAESGATKFKTAGIWSWHPKKKKYIWWMFNNWGYPQEGTATYCDESKHWKMKYKSVGFDGTSSYGLYEMTAVDDNTLEWRMDEWADALHIVKKLEMTGTYRRRQ